MRCAICKTDLGKKGRNPGLRVCGCCFKIYEGRYNPNDWKIVAPNVIAHKVLKCTFRIEGMKATMIWNPDIYAEKDITNAAQYAVDAYLDHVGFGRLKVRTAAPMPN